MYKTLKKKIDMSTLKVEQDTESWSCIYKEKCLSDNAQESVN